MDDREHDLPIQYTAYTPCQRFHLLSSGIHKVSWLANGVLELCYVADKINMTEP